MWPGTSCTSWLWIPALLSTGQGYLHLTSATNLGAISSHQGWGPLRATCFSSAAHARARVARFSTSSANILQFLYLRTSSAEFLLFTNSHQSSQASFLLVPFRTPTAFQLSRTKSSIAVGVLEGVPFPGGSPRAPWRQRCRPRLSLSALAGRIQRTQPAHISKGDGPYGRLLKKESSLVIRKKGSGLKVDEEVGRKQQALAVSFEDGEKSAERCPRNQC